MNDREKALRMVQMYKFTLVEANLFLDTHPDDQQALNYFKENKRLYEKVKQDFVSKYGPLQVSDVKDNADMWDWINGPWPWEGDQ